MNDTRYMGKIFAIEEFSVFDGPGIRMTVFLKGCPLRCQWCHNPEGQSFQTQIVRSPNGCIGCGACLEAGRKAVGVPMLTEQSIYACPNNLVRSCGEDVSAEELVKTVLKKEKMLRESGGGVTFSGGEPLFQAAFLKKCLEGVGDKLHKAIQTTGFCDKNTFEDILSLCDYVLYDLKHMDSKIHEKYTGVSNTQILENYRTLAASGKEFITRIPLIPGVNDTEENITAVCEFLAENNVNKIELLPYNKAAGAKYKLVGRKYVVDFDPTADPTVQTGIFEKYNIEVKVL